MCMSGDDPMAKRLQAAKDLPLGGKAVAPLLVGDLIRGLAGERPARRYYACHLVGDDRHIGVYDGFGAFVLPSPPIDLPTQLREAMQGLARRAVVVDTASARGALLEIDEAFRLVEKGNEVPSA
jgi:hypothetical protein